jgi:hypothetical protein
MAPAITIAPRADLDRMEDVDAAVVLGQPHQALGELTGELRF